MRGIPALTMFFLGLLLPGAWSQVLQLDDEDLAVFDGETEGPLPSSLPENRQPSLPTGIEADTSRYDELIDQLKAQLRQVRIELRDLPAAAEEARDRLRAMEASENELRRRAFERVVFRWPQPIFEDFDAALDEALDRQAIQQGLLLEIRTNEQAVRELEAERRALENDLDQALELKEEAREASLRDR